MAVRIDFGNFLSSQRVEKAKKPGRTSMVATQRKGPPSAVQQSPPKEEQPKESRRYKAATRQIGGHSSAQRRKGTALLYVLEISIGSCCH